MEKKRIPIARCPNPDCSRTLLFSCDPKDRLHITTKIADESYQGKTMICSRCKTTVAIIEKPKVARGYVAIPIAGTVQCWPKLAQTIESDLSSHRWTWEARVSIRRTCRALLCFLRMLIFLFSDIVVDIKSHSTRSFKTKSTHHGCLCTYMNQI